MVFNPSIMMAAANRWTKGDRVEPLELLRLGCRGEKREITMYRRMGHRNYKKASQSAM